MAPQGVRFGEGLFVNSSPYNGAPTGILTGELDDARFYNRALSALEVQQLYLNAPLCVPHRATAIAQMTNGFVIGATITDEGCGYTNTPLVLIRGGGPITAATATAVISNGSVVGITMTGAGIGYTNTPAIFIYSPLPFQLGLIRAVKPSFTDLLVGTNYQLQVSTDFATWINQGAPFTATDPGMAYPQYFDLDSGNQLYFRALQIH